jgi:UTP:GlnB (protein PII) uridylyltransferase
LPVVVFGIVVTLIGSAVLAQTAGEIEAARAYLQAERQDVVSQTLDLTEAEATAFWPLYREYRAELMKVGDTTVALLKDYAAKYGSMTDADASALLDTYFKAQQQELKVKQNYVGKFRKVLPGRKVTRFYQVENKVDALIRLQAAADVPLVK